MALSFLSIPKNVLSPGFYIEYDSSRAVQGTPAKKHTSLLIGYQSLPVSSPVDVPVRVTSLDDAKVKSGAGSMLARMVERYKAQDPRTELWILPITEPSGAPAEATFTYTGAATKAGTVVVYIGDDRYSAPVAEGASVTEIVVDIAGVINADADSLGAAGAVVGVLTITLKTDGTFGNSMRASVNLLDTDANPAGISVVVVDFGSGTGEADVAAGLAALGDMSFDSIGMAFNDDTNMDLLETLLNDRLGPFEALDGQCFIAVSDTVGNTTTAGNARNFQGTSLLGMQESPTPEFLGAAEFAGLDSVANQIDPGLHRNTLPLPGIFPPLVPSRWDFSEREIALSDGITTIAFDSGTSLARIQRLITTYQTNPAGFADAAYLDIIAPRILAFLRFSTRAHFALRYSRFKLQSTDEPIPAGQRIMSKTVAKAAFVELFDQWRALGLVENKEQFVENLVFDIDPADPDRLDVQAVPDLINSFHVLASSFQFLK